MRLSGLVVGVTTVAVTVGLFMLLRVGPSLFAAAVVTAATFSAASLACHRAPAGVAVGGAVPIVGLALAGVAFASLPWAGTLVVVATGFTFAAAHARRVRRRAWIAVVDAAGQLRVVHRGYDRSEPLARTLGDEIDRLLAH